MKIFFNLASLEAPKTGIGHYTQYLLEGMLAHPDISDVAGVKSSTVLTHATLRNLLRTDFSAKKHLPVSSTFYTRLKKSLRPWLRSIPGIYACRAAFQNFLLKSVYAQFAKQNFIYHETNFIPAPYKGKIVISVHDLSHIRYPEYHPIERVNYLNKALPKALARADKIITGSEFSRQELLVCFKIDPQKVITVLDGVDAQFSPREAQDVQSTLNKYSIQYQRYILSVCTLEPRKNLTRLLQAFSSLPADIRQAYPLVLVGGKGWKNQLLLDLAAPLLQSGELKLTGYVPQEDLPHLYAGAKIFAYPSIYEGFGLPVLEAMASGVPVVTSNTSSLPEVSCGSALEIDPLSVTEIANALSRLLNDADLQKSCIAKGLERAKLLTWQRCVEKTVDVYRSI